MHIIKLSFRNVIKGGQRSLLLLATLVFSFIMVVLANSFFTGMDVAANQNQVNINGGHLTISGVELSETGKRIRVISDVEKMQNALNAFEEDIAGYTIRNTQNIEFIAHTKTKYAQLTGINFADEAVFLQQLTWVEGDLSNILAHDDSVILLSDTVEELNLQLGEIVTVKTTTITGQETLASFVLRGIINPRNPSLKNEFSAGYVHLSAMNDLVALPQGQYAQYIVRLDSSREAMSIQMSLDIALRADISISLDRSQLGGLKFPSEFDIHLVDKYHFKNTLYKNFEIWEGTNFRVRSSYVSFKGGFNYMMQMLSFVIFVILLAITMVGIANSYHMIMLERQAEIGIMRAMGAQRYTIRILFRLEALFIALISIIIGLILVFFIVKIVEMIPFPATILGGYALVNGHFYLPLSLSTIAITAFFIIVTALLAVSSASEKAAKLEPITALNR